MSQHLFIARRAAWALGLVLCLLNGRPAAAQLQAVGGGRGMYVYAAARPAGSWAGATTRSVRVERQPATGAAFSAVAELSAPAAAAEFAARVQRYNRQLPVPLELQPVFLQRLSRTWERTHRLDSLRAYSQLLPVQQALGMVYFDSTAERGAAYVYRLTPQLTSGAAGPATVTARSSWPGKPTGGRMRSLPTMAGEKQIVVRWRQDEGPQRAVYAQLQRQDDARGEWRPAAARLTLQSFQKQPALVAYDQQVQPVRAYRYTLRTYDLHGNPGPVADTVLTASYDFLDAGVLRDFRAQALSTDNQAGIQLSWRLPDANKLRSVRVFRSTLLDKQYELLAEVSPGETGYLDATVVPMQKYYYYVQPTGLLQEPGVASSKVFALYEEQRPPLPPKQVFASSVPGGIRLRWLPGDTFTKGYYVYRGAGPDAPLTLVGAMRPHQAQAAEQVFVDSSRTLQPHLRYRYCVQAENSSHRQGLRSDTVDAVPGVRRTAATPVHALPAVAGLEGQWENGRPLVRWEATTGATGYEVRRQSAGQPSQPLPLGPRFPGSAERRPLTQPAFRDSTARPGQSYEYEVVALDDLGRRSAASRLSLPAEAPAPLAPAALTAAATGKAVELRWEAAANGATPQYRLYRYEPGTKPQAVATVAARSASYRDATVQPRRTYFYYVAALDARQQEAGRSDAVGVRVP